MLLAHNDRNFNASWAEHLSTLLYCDSLTFIIGIEYISTEKAAIMAKLYPSQEAHEGFHPLTERINPFSPLSSYDLEDQVMILLLRNAFRSGQRDRKIITRFAAALTVAYV